MHCIQHSFNAKDEPDFSLVLLVTDQLFWAFPHTIAALPASHEVGARAPSFD